MTNSIEDSSIVLDLDLSKLDTIYSGDTVYSSNTTTTTNWSVCDSDYFSLDNTITISDPTIPAGNITIGSHVLTEDKIQKLDALLDVIESAEGSEIKAMFDTALALNKLKGTNK